MRNTAWRSQDLLAWTRHEGPDRPPSAARRPLMLALAGAVSVVYVGMLFTDTLCPEHRAWVDAIAGASFVVAVAATVALVRGWSAAGPLAVLAASGGVAIGLLDAAHSPTRGRVIALLFTALVVAALAAVAANLRLRRWERHELRNATEGSSAAMAVAAPESTAVRKGVEPTTAAPVETSEADVIAPRRM